MSETTDRGGTAAGPAELVRALRKLRHADARAMACDDGGARIGRRDRPSGGDGDCTIPAAVWRVLRSRGWVVPEEAEGAWRIAESGRLALRRALSRSAADVAALAGRSERDRAQRPGTPAVNDQESPLAWLHRRKGADGRPMIDEVEFAAGERLRADFERGAMGPRLTVDWSATAGIGRGTPGLDQELLLKDSQVAARERVRRALAAVGPELSGVLIDVCCHQKGIEAAERLAGWPARSGKVVLRLALGSLARHYGLAGTGPRTTGIKHWATDDYRPRIGGDDKGSAQEA